MNAPSRLQVRCRHARRLDPDRLLVTLALTWSAPEGSLPSLRLHTDQGESFALEAWSTNWWRELTIKCPEHYLVTLFVEVPGASIADWCLVSESLDARVGTTGTTSVQSRDRSRPNGNTVAAGRAVEASDRTEATGGAPQPRTPTTPASTADATATSTAQPRSPDPDASRLDVLAGSLWKSAGPGYDRPLRAPTTHTAQGPTPFSPHPPSAKRWRVPNVAMCLAPLWVGCWTVAYGVALVVGPHYADLALQAGPNQVAVEVYTRTSDGSPELLGLVYGQALGRQTDEEQPTGKAMRVDAAAMSPGGHLHIWYRAIQALEDDEHVWPIGVHHRFPLVMSWNLVPYLWAKWNGSDRKIPGASSLSDQVCGLLLGGMPGDPGGGMKGKLAMTACGIALRQHFWEHPEEIGAWYATLAPLASSDDAVGVELFARRYWSMDGTKDSRLTRGHQIVLAAMANRLWNDDPARWEDSDPEVPDIRSRAALALDLLVEDGAIAVADREQVLHEIDGARPNTKAQAQGLGHKGHALPEEFTYLRDEIVHQLQHRWGVDPATAVRAVHVPFDRELQQSLHARCDEVLADLRRRSHASGAEAAHCSAIVTDSGGRVLAAYSGDRHGASNQDLFHAGGYSGASTGKLILVALAADRTEARPGDRVHLQGLEHSLRVSDSTLIGHMQASNVRKEDMRRMMTCYGQRRDGADSDYVAQLALGNWDTNAMSYLPFLAAVAVGQTEFESAFIDEVNLRSGERLTQPSAVFAEPPSADPWCAARAWAGGRTRAWAALPLRGGTLSLLDGRAEGGKTGTSPAVRNGVSTRGTNNTIVAAFGRVGPEQQMRLGWFTVGAVHSNQIDIGWSATGGNTAAFLAQAAFPPTSR
jgi:hypothetical protein